SAAGDVPLTIGTARTPGTGRDRHRRLLPRTVPPVHGFDVELYTRAASPLSGDFYDFIRLPDGRRAIVVGDVSGADVDRAVLMGTARKTISLRLRETPHVSQALAQVNDDLCDELDQESYVSAVVAILDADKREVWLARAGHPAPFLVRGGRPPSVERLEPPGPVLGFVPTASFEQGIELRRFPVQPGDVLLLHTDGLEDLKDPNRERFGPDRIAEVLRSSASADVTMILGALMLEAEQYAGTAARSEDVTAVCLKVR
ncbi:MAG TPA: SpoIIE family protein phosphatase, partial [Planctomycetota bacterium]|nr:SpoIIE family protein phosphatase [Planctomycetota bacterium]